MEGDEEAAATVRREYVGMGWGSVSSPQLSVLAQKDPSFPVLHQEEVRTASKKGSSYKVFDVERGQVDCLIQDMLLRDPILNAPQVCRVVVLL